MSTIRLTAFSWVPPFAQGLVRDLRVRWALEEAGLAYQVRLIGVDEKNSDDYRRQQPFAQVPVYEEEGTTLFESGAIVLHIANRSPVLLPEEQDGRARATAWLFAALNSIEPVLTRLVEIDLFHAKEAWAQQRRPGAEKSARARLQQLAEWLGDRDWLEERLTAGDLMMTTVLRVLRHTDLLAQFPNLEAYRQRCEARPAFRKALADHMAPFANAT